MLYAAENVYCLLWSLDRYTVDYDIGSIMTSAVDR